MLRVAHPPGFEAERRWVVSVLLGELLGLEHELVAEERADVELSLAGEPGALRIADGLFALPRERWLTTASLPREPLEERDGVPMLYGTAAEPDWFGDAFFHLSRYEELVRPERDGHGRLPVEASLAGRCGFLDRAVVDRAADALFAELQRLWPRLERRRAEFAVVPSHDVDWPYTTPRTALEAAVWHMRARRPALAARHLASLAVRRLDPWDTFDLLMTASERRGLRSSFNVIAADGVSAHRGGYLVGAPRTRRLLHEIDARGHELGFHPSYDAFDDVEVLRRELAALRAVCAEEGIDQPVDSGRQHFLRWQPSTWRDWDDAGLALDSTLGWSGRAGFRCGTCHDYQAFDVERGRPLRLRERPLVAMDVTLLLHGGLDADAAYDRLKPLKDECRRHGGRFTLLWHNSMLLNAPERALYEAALDA